MSSKSKIFFLKDEEAFNLKVIDIFLADAEALLELRRMTKNGMINTILGRLGKDPKKLVEENKRIKFAEDFESFELVDAEEASLK